MVNGKILLCVVLVTAWCEVRCGRLPLAPAQLGDGDLDMHPAALVARVREGVPPPLCAGRRCVAPRAGPVCAFDATGTARTFATLCELQAVSCRESTYYAITSLGEC